MSHNPVDDLREPLLALGCDPSHVAESFTHSGGAGGQNVNKVATCVQLQYPAARISIKMQKHRTQAGNRRAAWVLLLRMLQQAKAEARAAQIAERELRRRQKAVRPHWLKARILDMKRHQSAKKKARSTQSDGGEHP